jgi:hypothetical protein
MVEVLPAGAACAADRSAPSSSLVAAAKDQLTKLGACSDPGDSTCSSLTFCEIPRAENILDCWENPTPNPSSAGWCYVDPGKGIGSSEVIPQCQPPNQRAIRFLGTDVPAAGARVLAECKDVHATFQAPVGAPCITSDEYEPSLSGESIGEILVEDQSLTCQSGICVSNHFQGRASCPYGGTECSVPGSGGTQRITVSVPPQLESRPANTSVICTCRCAGPGSGPFCSCPANMQCEHLTDDLGFGGLESTTGSFCIPKGTQYDPTALQIPCDRATMSCGPETPYP